MLRFVISATAGIATMALALQAGCTAPYHMGDTLRADPTARVPEHRSGSAQRKAGEWELRWEQIQESSNAVKWTDHFHVCGLRYRFRNYEQLFRCLDLLEAR